jgi:hypothetical protein
MCPARYSSSILISTIRSLGSSRFLSNQSVETIGEIALTWNLLGKILTPIAVDVLSLVSTGPTQDILLEEG